MRMIALLLTAFVALSHIGIMILEMFYWNHPVGRQVFNMTPEISASSAVLAANQGLYNGFLAAGLVWGLVWRGGGLDGWLAHPPTPGGAGSILLI